MALTAANASRLVPLNRTFSGVTTVLGGHRYENLGLLTGPRRNWYVGDHAISGQTDRSSVPDGARHPVAWLMAPKAGGLSSRSEADFGLTVSPLALAEGRNLAGSTEIQFTVSTASLELVVSAEGTASITFSVGNAVLAGALFGAGSSSITFTVGSPTLGAVIDAVGAAAINWTAGATIAAIGHMEGDITPFTELSPQSLAQAVLDSSVEGDVKLSEVLRILLSYAAGDATGLDGDPVFKSRDGSKDRLAGTISGGARVITTFDAT